MESFCRALAGKEWMIAFVHVVGEQRSRVRIGARDDERRHIQNIGGQPRGDQMRNGSASGMRTLPPMCPHFFSLAS